MTGDSRWRQVSDDVLRGIADGTFPVGSRIPSVRSMCHRWGIGHGTAQRVIERLTALGVVEGRKGSGVWVVAQPDAIDLDIPTVAQRLAGHDEQLGDHARQLDELRDTVARLVERVEGEG